MIPTYTIRCHNVAKRLDDLARRLSPAAAEILFRGGNYETTINVAPLAPAGGDPSDRDISGLRLRTLQAGR